MKTIWFRKQLRAVIDLGIDYLKLRLKRPLAGLAAVAFITFPALQMPQPELVPSVISMGSFYDGASMHVEGEAPAASGVIIVVRGVEKDEFFNRKDRFGPIWLNADRIHFQNAPSLFYAFSSADAESMLGRADLDKYELDETAILHRIRCLCHCKCDLTEAGRQTGARDAIPDPAYREVLVKEFLQAREHDGAYRTMPRSVTVEQRASSLHYKLEFPLPVNLAAGSYEIQVVACDRRQVIAHSERTLVATKVGLAAYIQNLAFQSPWMYGAAAVFIALITGFAMDFLSSKGLRRRKLAAVAKGESPELAPDKEHEAERTRESDAVHHH